LTPGQCRAARALIGWSQDELAAASKVAKATIANFELGKRAPYARTLEDLSAALEAGGVEFTNGGQPGVRMKKTKSGKLLDERERAETAKTLAREWTAYCKEHNSMAFASASDDLILVQFQKVGSGEVSNLLNVRVLDRDFELDGTTFEKDALERVVFGEMESHPYRI
jgi:transcriptional regulator with XRE-family HTH domain